MGHGKQTPRQKMIGMMYLFLTALLALNISKEVLDAFILIEHGVGKTVVNFAKKNELYYNLFSKAATENKAKAGQWNDKALQVKAKADETVKFLQDIRREIIKQADGDKKEPGTLKVDDIQLKDNTEYVPKIMIVDGKGTLLKKKIEEFRKYIITQIDKPDKHKDLIAGLEKTLDTSDPPAEEGVLHSWESERFEHLPLIASVAFMTIIEGDIRNAEADILSYLYSKIDAADMKFNKIEAIVKQNSNYVMSGNKFHAEIFLAAYDSTQRPTVFINADYDPVKNEVTGNDTLPVENGKGIKEETAGGTGEKKMKGVIRIKGPEGFKYYPWNASYTAAQGGVVVSPTKMNVFYRGIPNPISISAVGYTADATSASATNGNLKSIGGGNYEFLPGDGLESIISVSVKGEGGSKSAGAPQKFRVKNIPDPVAKINGKSQGKIPKNQLTAAPGIAADLADFPFDLKYSVTSYSVIQTVAGISKVIDVPGNLFSGPVMAVLKSLGAGSTVVFTNIKARGPDGKTRNLSPIVFQIQ